MIDPISFAARMEGLAYVPDPLWWLLGAIVSFYFGARELHYRRGDKAPKVVVKPAPKPEANPKPIIRSKPTEKPDSENAALDDWRQKTGG